MESKQGLLEIGFSPCGPSITVRGYKSSGVQESSRGSGGFSSKVISFQDFVLERSKRQRVATEAGLRSQLVPEEFKCQFKFNC
jgi:hypothetical protein